MAGGFSTASFLIDGIGHLASLEEFAEDARDGRLPRWRGSIRPLLAMGAASTDEGPPADIEVGKRSWLVR